MEQVYSKNQHMHPARSWQEPGNDLKQARAGPNSTMTCLISSCSTFLRASADSQCSNTSVLSCVLVVVPRVLL